MLTSRSPWDTHTEDLGDGLAEGELYFWAEIKGKENKQHVVAGHNETYGRCRTCDNCLCPEMQRRWTCRCAAGKKQITPYRIRFMKSRDKERYA